MEEKHATSGMSGCFMPLIAFPLSSYSLLLFSLAYPPVCCRECLTGSDREKERERTGGNLFPFLVIECAKIHSIFKCSTFFTRIMIYFHDHVQGMSSRSDRMDKKASECVGNTPLHASSFLFPGT